MSAAWVEQHLDQLVEAKARKASAQPRQRSAHWISPSTRGSKRAELVNAAGGLLEASGPWHYFATASCPGLFGGEIRYRLEQVGERLARREQSAWSRIGFAIEYIESLGWHVHVLIRAPTSDIDFVRKTLIERMKVEDRRWLLLPFEQRNDHHAGRYLARHDDWDILDVPARRRKHEVAPLVTSPSVVTVDPLLTNECGVPAVHEDAIDSAIPTAPARSALLMGWGGSARWSNSSESPLRFLDVDDVRTSLKVLHKLVKNGSACSNANDGLDDVVLSWVRSHGNSATASALNELLRPRLPWYAHVGRIRELRGDLRRVRVDSDADQQEHVEACRSSLKKLVSATVKLVRENETTSRSAVVLVAVLRVLRRLHVEQEHPRWVDAQVRLVDRDLVRPLFEVAAPWIAVNIIDGASDVDPRLTNELVALTTWSAFMLGIDPEASVDPVEDSPQERQRRVRDLQRLAFVAPALNDEARFLVLTSVYATTRDSTRAGLWLGATTEWRKAFEARSSPEDPRWLRWRMPSIGALVRLHDGSVRVVQSPDFYRGIVTVLDPNGFPRDVYYTRFETWRPIEGDGDAPEGDDVAHDAAVRANA